MDSNKVLKLLITTVIFVSLISPTGKLQAQHRGDNLSFQGFGYKDNITTNASAMGSAMTAVAGDVSSLFFNTAGLSRIDNIQISINGSQNNRQWWENQNYWPNRACVELPLYLEGLYIPLRENSGRWNYEMYKDSNYIINAPQLGLDSYDKAAADWTNYKKEMGLKNVSIAVPFSLMDQKLVAGVSYLRTSINDYDRNDTYLYPFVNSYDYEQTIKTVNGIDTLVMDWNRFLRQRTGAMNNIVAGLSTEIVKNVMVGVGAKIQNGKSDDFQSLVRVGDFHLIDAQKFKFFFVDSSTNTIGTSKYSSVAFNLGAMVEISKMKMGLKVDLPYTYTRDWNYTKTISGADTSIQLMSGKDKVNVPAVFNVGISFQPANSFLFSFNYEFAPYSKTTFELASADTALRKWTDQNTIAFGIKYDWSDVITLMAGYRAIPEVFVPDGAAIRDKGPGANSYNFGISANTFLGRIDLAYEYRAMRYYDSYYTNTNFVVENNSTIMMGITYSF